MIRAAGALPSVTLKGAAPEILWVLLAFISPLASTLATAADRPGGPPGTLDEQIRASYGYQPGETADAGATSDGEAEDRPDAHGGEKSHEA